MEQSTDKALTIERNHIQPMAAFEFSNPNRPTQPTPAANEIWYTATAKVEPTFDDALTFGADVVSNVWDSETKRGIIAFNGDVTMIGVDAFNNCDKLTSITLPECVTSIGKNAFYDCDVLTEFTIPDSLTTIGDYAFYDCSSLTSMNIPDSV
ncbi:MAG: leucine-rich repeat domain-containing protein, partial [Alistipes sp.]|nr:leucine-rich repeat domain-containing protein [Alistipes sp.]